MLGLHVPAPRAIRPRLLARRGCLSGEAHPASGRGPTRRPAAGGFSIGELYEEKKVTLGPGEGVLFYSDGVVEAHDPEGEMFGFPRLRALVGTHLEAGSLGDNLLEELYSFVGEGWEQEDDITLLTLRRSAPRSRT